MTAIKKFMGNTWFLLISFLAFVFVILFFFSSIVFSRSSLCFLLSGLTGLSFFLSIWFKWNPERFIPQLSNILIAVATIFMAVATFQSVNISNKLGDIEEQNLNHNEAALETEFRPYLDITLLSNKYPLIKKGNYSFLNVPFQIVNVGKYPAIGIKAEYHGPVQNSPIEPEEKMDHLLSDKGRIYVPDINIGNLADNSTNEAITTVLQVVYQGILKTDKNEYCSEMKLIIKKKNIDNKVQYNLANSVFKLKCD